MDYDEAASVHVNMPGGQTVCCDLVRLRTYGGCTSCLPTRVPVTVRSVMLESSACTHSSRVVCAGS